MEIEFDPRKAASNMLDHEGVSFEEASAVLLDPYALTREDEDANGEQRFITLGGSKGTNSGGSMDAARRPYTYHLGMEGQSSTTEAL